ncbi:hypothetical protein DCAR_0414784 [Daucus carota subsp. sativus]|uniref:Uncharacterized protein n=1 Tax=Daucus carota subsp. sativus TaxID=79200 RepID=A0A165A0Q5_DAUCS|nr:hypothetical protein DCAR_0414784 [Daucus carota subsp. sativus]
MLMKDNKLINQEQRLGPGNEEGAPVRKRGRPRIVVTNEVLEQRRLARQRVNANRPRSQAPPTATTQTVVVEAENTNLQASVSQELDQHLSTNPDVMEGASGSSGIQR